MHMGFNVFQIGDRRQTGVILRRSTFVIIGWLHESSENYIDAR